MWKTTKAVIIGADHKMSGRPGSRNCQDACFVETRQGITIGIVSDGCSSGMYSEVGAHFSVNTLAKMLFSAVARARSFGQEFTEWERLRLQFLSHVSVVAEGMGDSYSSVIKQYFLFSIVGFVITPEGVTIFSVGDGSYFVNGKESKLGPFPKNEPPYIAYGLLNHEIPVFRLVRIAVDDVATLVVGTDGVDYLGETESTISNWVQRDETYNNSDRLRRYLVMHSPEKVEHGVIVPSKLKDDVAIVIARRFDQ